MFQFWYKYIPSHIDLITNRDTEYLYDEFIKPTLHDFMGHNYEEMCKQYIREKSRNNDLPFKVTRIGSWWGTNNKIKIQCEIDIVAFDDTKLKEAAIFCECKFRNELCNMEILEKLMEKSQAINVKGKKYYMLFFKSGFTKELIKKARENDNILLITLDEMYE